MADASTADYLAFAEEEPTAPSTLCHGRRCCRGVPSVGGGCLLGWIKDHQHLVDVTLMLACTVAFAACYFAGVLGAPACIAAVMPLAQMAATARRGQPPLVSNVALVSVGAMMLISLTQVVVSLSVEWPTAPALAWATPDDHKAIIAALGVQALYWGWCLWRNDADGIGLVRVDSETRVAGGSMLLPS
jgi:hypothetical protein